MARKTSKAPKPTKRAAAVAPLSMRAYAKHRNVSPEAVRKAINAGRLDKSLTRRHGDGTPKIADVELADREWEAKTQPRIDQPAAPRDPPEYIAHRTAREGASARLAAAQAELAEMQLRERKGELVDAEQARLDVVTVFSLVKTRLLGVPTMVGQRLPELADQVVPIVDELIRDALLELSKRGVSDGVTPPAAPPS